MAPLKKQVTKCPQTKEWERECIKTRRNLWLRKRRLNMFSIKESTHILDLGCGDGLNIKILRGYGIKNIIGIDISVDLLKLARKNNQTIKFILAPAENLPFKNNVFDIVLVDSVFHHLVDYPHCLDEILRVLKKGGYLCFSEPHRSKLRKIFDLITLSPLHRLVPYLNSRHPAYLAEKDLMENWLEKEAAFFNLTGTSGFKKIFCRVDLLSVVGKYRKM